MKRRAMNGTACSMGIVFMAICALLIGTLAGCDENVTTKLVQGMNAAANSAASALIDAAFLAITPEVEPYSNNTGGGDVSTDSSTAN